MRALLFSLACLGFMLAAPPAAAETARDRFDRANEAFDAGRYDDAFAGFIDCASSGSERDLACRCTAMAGFAAKAVSESARARLFFIEFEQDCQEPPASADDAASRRWAAMLAAAKSEVARLEELLLADHGVVHVVATPRGAVVRVDGRTAGALADLRAPALLYLTPGSHAVQLSADGHLAVSRTIDVVAGARDMIRLDLQADTPPEAHKRPVATEERVADPTTVITTTQHVVDDGGPGGLAIAGWVGVGVGLGLAATGGAFTALAHDDVADLEALYDQGAWSDSDRGKDASLRRRAQARQDASIGFYVAGGAVAAAGLTLALIDMFSSSETAPEQSGQVFVVPARGGITAGVSLEY